MALAESDSTIPSVPRREPVPEDDLRTIDHGANRQVVTYAEQAGVEPGADHPTRSDGSSEALRLLDGGDLRQL